MNKGKFATVNLSGTEFSKGHRLNQLNGSLTGPTRFQEQ